MLQELIKELNDKGIEIAYSKGKLEYSGPERNITPDLLQKLKDNKASLIRYLWPSENSNLIPVNLTGNLTPLILIHGSNAVNFLSEYFKGERPILNFLDIGSNGERIHSKNIEEMAKLYIDQLIELAPKGPYIFCGFSFGGLLAVKMAELLQEKDVSQVPCIILFDTKTPQTPENSKIYKVVHIVKGNRIIFLFQAFLRKIEKLKFLSMYYFKKNIIYTGKPLPSEFRKYYISSMYGKLADSYFPAKINSDFLIFRSMENLSIDPQLGWGEFAKSIDLFEIEGNHHGILFLEKNYRLISGKISSFIQKYESKWYTKDTFVENNPIQ